jgi:hypothetical protein
VPQQEPSFSEEKEAKRLHSFAKGNTGPIRIKRIEVFWFFFSKKNK